MIFTRFHQQPRILRQNPVIIPVPSLVFLHRTQNFTKCDPSDQKPKINEYLHAISHLEEKLQLSSQTYS